MQLIINVPDTLPQERLAQIIKEVEQRIINESKSFMFFSTQKTVSNAEKTKYPNFVDFIRNSPLMNADVDFERDNSFCREIEL